MEKNQKWLLRNFHGLCSRAGVLGDNKEALISSYGHISSADMSDDQLKDACLKLQKMMDPKMDELDVWRKRVFGAIGGFLRFSKRTESPDYIRAIACKATGFEHFNDIPVDRLRNVYNSFCQRQKDLERSWKAMQDILSGNE